MAHQMGLLKGEIPTAAIADNVIVYDGNTYDVNATGEKWKRVLAECTSATWNASTTFTSSTNKPYHDTTNKILYYVAKTEDATISVSATAGTQLYAWSVSGDNTTVSTKNVCKSFTIVTPDYSNAFNQKIWKFSYSGNGKQWVAPHTGTYTMECWGAEGKTLNSNRDWPGKGGYTSGEIDLTDETCLYIYVGGTGDLSTANVDAAGGFNGGGYSNSYSGGTTTTGGGGSTDIRIKKHSLGSWGYDRSTHTGDVSLSSRIMVAAGGGGCGNYYAYYVSGGSGGGIYGQPSLSGYKTAEGKYHAGATQTSSASSRCTNSEGHFGYANQKESSHSYGGGGGGGYWGGTRGWGNGGSGGSSYISGHKGCVAIISESNQNPKTGPDNTIEKASHYSGFVFKDGTTIIIDGDGFPWTSSQGTAKTQMPNPAGGKYDVGIGQTGNGYARITYIPD